LAVIIGFGLFRQHAQFPQGQFNHAAYGPYALTLAVLSRSQFYRGVGTHHRPDPALPQPTGPAKTVNWVGALKGKSVDALRNLSSWMFQGF
jgi:hypothetical protein